MKVLRSDPVPKQQESSIYDAYLKEIESATKYIYNIENQFFISSLPCQSISLLDQDVRNTIKDALCKRIIDVHKIEEDFHVFIILPLVPAEPNLETCNVLNFKMAYTLYKGDNSLMRKLEKKISKEKIPDYISIYSLRTHGELNGNLISEMIYVHSKVMIVDDCTTIIGSANINDRSMLGEWDSEVNVIIKHGSADNFSKSLRLHLFNEHLGYLDEQSDDRLIIDDPIDKSFIESLSKLAKENTKIYKDTFRDDERIIGKDGSRELSSIHGRLVSFEDYKRDIADGPSIQRPWESMLHYLTKKTESTDDRVFPTLCCLFCLIICVFFSIILSSLT